uniref:Uncharacterized protein n=1 Tax=Dulem virus 36 TaxID=3145754 RepID=A0AAU8AYI2_9CAUD
MAMVNIRRGNNYTRVSKSAYESHFRKLGYRIIAVDESIKTQPDIMETVSEAEDIETIPISDMSKDQLIEFARKHNISLAGTKGPNDARRVIKRAMQERRM